MLFVELRRAEYPCSRRAFSPRAAVSVCGCCAPPLGYRRRACRAGGRLATLALRRFGRHLRGPRLGGRRPAGDSHHAVPAAGELLLRPLLSRAASTLAPLEALRSDFAGLAAPQGCQAKDKVDLARVLFADDRPFHCHRRAALGGACCGRGGRSIWAVVRSEAADGAERNRRPCRARAILGKADAVIWTSRTVTPKVSPWVANTVACQPCPSDGRPAADACE